MMFLLCCTPAVAPLLEDALMDRDLVHRQTAAFVVQHMSLGVAGETARLACGVEHTGMLCGLARAAQHLLVGLILWYCGSLADLCSFTPPSLFPCALVRSRSLYVMGAQFTFLLLLLCCRPGLRGCPDALAQLCVPQRV